MRRPRLPPHSFLELVTLELRPKLADSVAETGRSSLLSSKPHIDKTCLASKRGFVLQACAAATWTREHAHAAVQVLNSHSCAITSENLYRSDTDRDAYQRLGSFSFGASTLALWQGRICTDSIEHTETGLVTTPTPLNQKIN